MEDRTVTITLNEYTKLIRNDEKIEQLKRETNNSQYSLSRETIARICDFELVKPDDIGGVSNE